MIDGVDEWSHDRSAGTAPNALAVKHVTNKVYVANANGGTVTVIDGVIKPTATVNAVLIQLRVNVNPVTNKIYVATHDPIR